MIVLGKKEALYLCCSDVIICVVWLLFVLFYKYVVFVCKCVLPPGDNLIAVNKYIISFCQCRELLPEIFGQSFLYVRHPDSCVTREAYENAK
jgi:hypothetical protein